MGGAIIGIIKWYYSSNIKKKKKKFYKTAYL